MKSMITKFDVSAPASANAPANTHWKQSFKSSVKCYLQSKWKRTVMSLLLHSDTETLSQVTFVI